MSEQDRDAAARALAAKAPERCMVGSVRCGTAGWTDPTLLASGFYPKGQRSSAARLAYYAEQLALVEVDATFYALPTLETVQRWVERTPSTFCFDVKAHPVLTGHPLDPRRLPAELARELPAVEPGRRVPMREVPAAVQTELENRFLALLAPLVVARRFGSLLLQFPPWFDATRGNARTLERLAERCAGLQCAVEFRHRSWLAEERRERVRQLLTSLGFSYVIVDEPDVPNGGVPAVPLVAAPSLAIVRLHGRNIAGWTKANATVHERFDWLYSPAELTEWVAPIRQLAQQAEQVHVVFNNCVRDSAVVGARGLAALLAEAAPSAAASSRAIADES